MLGVLLEVAGIRLDNLEAQLNFRRAQTAENFRQLCTGEAVSTEDGKPLSYKGCPFHRIIRCHPALYPESLNQLAEPQLSRNAPAGTSWSREATSHARTAREAHLCSACCSWLQQRGHFIACSGAGSLCTARSLQTRASRTSTTSHTC